MYAIYLGEECNFNQELKLLKLEKQMALLLMYIGAAFILTAGVGWSAVATKNEVNTYCVSNGRLS